LEGVKVFTDGASRGNPGEAGFGVVIRDTGGKLLEEISGYLGQTTNNVAEYRALIAALKALSKYVTGGKKGSHPKIEIFSDSELMVRQVRGLYRVKSPGLLPLYQEAVSLLEGMKTVTLTHIPRELNREADALANRAVDRKSRR